MIDTDKINCRTRSKNLIGRLMKAAFDEAGKPYNRQDAFGIWDSFDIAKMRHKRMVEPDNTEARQCYIDAIADAVEQATPDEIARVIYALMGFERKLLDAEIEAELADGN